METTPQTLLQIERAIRKIAEKFPTEEEPTTLTDIHIRVAPETGELVAFDDDDREITRCIIEAWIDEKDEDFYDQAASLLRKSLREHSDMIDSMSILKPFSFVLENEELDMPYELYLADGDTVIVDTDLMEGLNDDLDDFFQKLMNN